MSSSRRTRFTYQTSFAVSRSSAGPSVDGDSNRKWRGRVAK